MSIQYFISLEYGAIDKEPKVLGPFPGYVQLTYDALTVGPEGREVAFIDINERLWFTLDNRDDPYSDVVIYAVQFAS